MEAMSAELSLPPRTSHRYQSGVTMPAQVLLRFIVATAASLAWLLTAPRAPLPGPVEGVRGVHHGGRCPGAAMTEMPASGMTSG